MMILILPSRNLELRHKVKEGDTFIYRTKAPLYGDPIAPKAWFNTLLQALRAFEFTEIPTAFCLSFQKEMITSMD